MEPMNAAEHENAKFVANQMGISEEAVENDPELNPLKLKDDGNITRQILAMIGHDTLESVYGVYHDGKGKSCCGTEQHRNSGGSGQNADLDPGRFSDGENDGE